MTPFIETPIPQPAAEDREPIIVPFDPTECPKHYPNRLYEYLHQIIKRERDLDTIIERRGDEYLVILPAPLTGASTTTDYTITFTAALIHVHGQGCDGWLVSSHEAARATWEASRPQAA